MAALTFLSSSPLSFFAAECHSSCLSCLEKSPENCTTCAPPRTFHEGWCVSECLDGWYQQEARCYCESAKPNICYCMPATSTFDRGSYVMPKGGKCLLPIFYFRDNGVICCHSVKSMGAVGCLHELQLGSSGHPFCCGVLIPSWIVRYTHSPGNQYKWGDREKPKIGLCRMREHCSVDGVALQALHAFLFFKN